MNDYSPKPDSEGTPSYYSGGTPPQNPYNQPYYGPAAPPQPNPQQFNSPYANPAYQQLPQPPMNPYGQPQQKQSNSAMISFITGVISFLFAWVIPVIGVASSVVGIVFGHKSLKETSGGEYNSGRGLGITGLVCSYVALVCAVLWSIFLLVMVVAAATAPSYY